MGAKMDIPGDFFIEYYFSEGSVPPPHHYEYGIAIKKADGSGVIRYFPDYSAHYKTPVTRSFKVSESGFAELFSAVKVIEGRKWDYETDKVGGATESVEIVYDKRVIRIKENPIAYDKVKPLYQKINGLVPAEIWKELKNIRDEYIKNYKK
ncbi:MAG: hypothetical protein FJ088_04050 [Deltaproteobacteria bacterium]|nr:hypothetical protein [Deltaproteobacteria bacterium]